MSSHLGLAWYYDTGSLPGTLEASPVISNGTLYGTVTWGVVFAVDARTGKEKWRWDPQLGHQNFPPGSMGKPDSEKVRTGPSLCCGPGNRGVAVYGGKVYVGTLDARLVALDAETGKVVWEVPTADKNSDYSITGAPLIVKGKVIIGNGGGEFAVRGYISAYDPETGKMIWRFYTVPGDPSKPFENKAMEAAAKTWSGDIPWWKLGGGGNPWNSISYDPQLDLLYFGTGQAGPWVQKYRSAMGQDNLYICSIIAVKPETGKFVWYFQTTPGDEWDFDSIADLVQADIKIDGKVRKVIMQAPKNGYFYVLDRKTGEFISGAPLQKITWAKGLDPKTGRPNINPEAHFGTTGTIIWPGPGGGHVWQGMSLQSANASRLHHARNGHQLQLRAGAGIQARAWRLQLGNHFQGRRRQRHGPGRSRCQRRAASTASSASSAGGKFPLRVGSRHGNRTLARSRNRWRRHHDHRRQSGFRRIQRRRIRSLQRGQRRKTLERAAEQGFANPVSYMLDGKQYVSVLAGRTGKGRLYTFALDGKVPVPPPPAPAAAPPPPAGEAR